MADRAGSSTVPFEQIGHSAKKRLWRQKVGTASQPTPPPVASPGFAVSRAAFSSGRLITPSDTASSCASGRLRRTISIEPWNQALPG